MKRVLPMILAACLLLTGCGWLDGSYYRVTPHRQQSVGDESRVEAAENYLQLRTALENMVSTGVESSIISVKDFLPERLDVIAYTRKNADRILTVVSNFSDNTIDFPTDILENAGDLEIGNYSDAPIDGKLRPWEARMYLK